MEVMKHEQRSYVKIAFLHGRNGREYHTELRKALGVHAMPYRTVARWVEVIDCNGSMFFILKPLQIDTRSVATPILYLI